MEICAVGTVAILVMISLGFKFKDYIAFKKELSKVRRENENNIAYITSAKSARSGLRKKPSYYRTPL